MKWPKRLLYAFGLVIAGSAAFDIYARIPARLDVEPLGLDPATRTAVLLFHGSGARDEPTLMAVEERFRALARGQPGTAVMRYIWSPYSEKRFRAAVNGAAVGEALGAELAGLPRLESIHLIGHSAGAYPLDPLCESYRKAGGRARIVITYLDPIGIQGVLDFGWGARNYGACADYAEAFINTDDPVPATNSPLAHAWNVDVTAAGKLAALRRPRPPLAGAVLPRAGQRR